MLRYLKGLEMTVSKAEETEVNIVGSSTFGRYPKISAEKTVNMFISDNWLVNYAGFKNVLNVASSGTGRGFYNSIRGDFLITVIAANVWRINPDFSTIIVGTIITLTGDVYIDENLASQICIVDGNSAYIYNYSGVPTFTLQTSLIDPVSGMPFFPSYVSYHNTFFLFGSTITSPNSSAWYAFEFDTATTIKFNSQFLLQTKPDTALVVERLPGRGNNVLVLGSTVGEIWTQVGRAENYRRVSSFNIDNGVVAPSTLAASEEFICWLSQNENNSPSIMYTSGGEVKRISSDGIDHVLDQLQFPAQSTAFFFRQDGHLFYQLTFFNPVDNLTLLYDFNTSLFFNVTDQSGNYHPARQVVFFHEKVYFISLNNGTVYLMDSTLLTYNYSIDPTLIGDEIPRIRICKSIRKKNSDRFRVGQFTFWIEQGVNNFNQVNPIVPRVDMSISKDGNQTFSNIVSRVLNTQAHFRNQIRWWRMGQANEFTIQLNFVGFQRFVAGPAVVEFF